MKEYRLSVFNSLKGHAWYGLQFKKLNNRHILIINEFIDQFGDLDSELFNKKRYEFLNLNGYNEANKAERSRLMICEEIITILIKSS